MTRPAYVSSVTNVRNNNYISRETNTIYIININKEVSKMEFDLNKIKEFYGELLAKRDEAVSIALAGKEAKIQERFEEEKARIEAEVVAEIIAEAEAPYTHDIELCEKFIVVQDENEEHAEENIEE